MKIGFLLDTTLDSNDGVQQYVKTLGDWMSSNGHKIAYLAGESLNNPDSGEVHSLSKNIDIRSNSNKVSVPFIVDYKKILDVIDNSELDIIHVQAPFSPLLAGVILSLFDTPRVATIHIYPSNIAYEIGSRLIPIIQKSSYESFYKVITVSEAANDYAENILKLKNTSIIPNVINLENYTNAKPLEKYSDGKINILSLGRLVKRKGTKYLLEAFNMLDKDLQDQCRIIIAGRGEYEKELKKYVEKNNLQNIEFVGFVEENLKPSYFASANISVFPSTEGESFGIVLLEAMAGNSAILAFNNEGYSSVLRPELEYSLVDVKNVDQLALKLSTLITDSKKRKELSSIGTRIVKEYDVNKIGPKLIKIYQEAVEEYKKH